MRQQGTEEEPSEYQIYYAIVRKIPRGRVMTYGDVARSAARPLFARRVGYALAALQDPSVPWWRVINARGEISARGWGGAQADQRDLLQAEGVVFDPAGRIDLARYRHAPTERPARRSRATRQAVPS